MLLLILFILPAVCAAVTGICSGAFQSLAWLWVLPVTYLGAFLAVLLCIGLLILISSAVINKKKPQENDSRFYRWLTYSVIDLVLPLLPVRLHVQGLEKNPKENRVLLVCNHLHEIDPAILMKYFPEKQLAFIAKREVEDMPVVGNIMYKLLCQTVNRENDREALKTILKCIQLLKDEKVSIGVFPEGYIREDRKLHHFRSGVFKIAQKTGVPIMVCTLQNTNHVISNTLRLKSTDVHMHLLTVLYPQDYAHMTTIELAEHIYQMMVADLGPENVSQDP